MNKTILKPRLALGARRQYVYRYIKLRDLVAYVVLTSSCYLYQSGGHAIRQICLTVCLAVCICAASRKKLRTDLHGIFINCRS